MVREKLALRFELAVVLGLLVLPQTIAHFVWLRNENGEAVVTFQDKAGGPGPLRLQEMIINQTDLHMASLMQPSPQPLALSMRTVTGGAAELVAKIPAMANTDCQDCIGNIGLTDTIALEGSVVFGIFPRSNPEDPPLLKYSFNAHRVHTPLDWEFIETVQREGRLSVTLRVYGTPSRAGASDTALVAVVTMLNYRPIGGVQVKLFDAAGVAIGEVTTDSSGTAPAEVPVDSFVYALANHLEHNPGIDTNGKAYNNIAHYATTSMKLMPTELKMSRAPWWIPATLPDLEPAELGGQKSTVAKALGRWAGGRAESLGRAAKLEKQSGWPGSRHMLAGQVGRAGGLRRISLAAQAIATFMTSSLALIGFVAGVSVTCAMLRGYLFRATSSVGVEPLLPTYF